MNNKVLFAVGLFFLILGLLAKKMMNTSLVAYVCLGIGALIMISHYVLDLQKKRQV